MHVFPVAASNDDCAERECRELLDRRKEALIATLEAIFPVSFLVEQADLRLWLLCVLLPTKLVSFVRCWAALLMAGKRMQLMALW